MPKPWQYYRFFPSDYATDCAHLSLLEHGVYRRLIDRYMLDRQPIPFDLPRLYRYLHATSKEEQQAVQAVIEEFFRMDGGVLRNKRCEEELDWQNSRSKTSAAAADSRWNGCERNADAMPTHSERNADGMPYREREKEEEKDQKKSQKHLSAKKPADAHSAPFLAFWTAYPHFHDRSSKSQAWKRWQTFGLDPLLAPVLAAVDVCRRSPDWQKDGGQFVPSAESWLRKRLWEQEIVDPDEKFMQDIANDPRFKGMT